MNLMIHLVRKDAILWGWTLAFWAACGACALVVARANPPATSPYYPLLSFSVVIQALLAFVLIAWILQEDSTRDPAAFWRSRPISPGTLLKAKLALIGALFVAAPIGAFYLAQLLSPEETGGASRLLQAAVFLSAAVLACAALAACTKNLVEYLLITVSCLLAGNLLTSWWREYAAISTSMARVLVESRSVAIAILVTALSVGVLLIQYHRPRTILSLGVITLALVATSLIRAFWTWQFI